MCLFVHLYVLSGLNTQRKKKKGEGRRKEEEGRRKKEGRRKEEEGRRKKVEGRRIRRAEDTKSLVGGSGRGG